MIWIKHGIDQSVKEAQRKLTNPLALEGLACLGLDLTGNTFISAITFSVWRSFSSWHLWKIMIKTTLKQTYVSKELSFSYNYKLFQRKTQWISVQRLEYMGSFLSQWVFDKISTFLLICIRIAAINKSLNINISM